LLKKINWDFAIGILIGNWLVVPWLYNEKNFKDGFFIGLIAVLLLYLLVVKLYAFFTGQE
jgi:hypothetical protein